MEYGSKLIFWGEKIILLNILHETDCQIGSVIIICYFLNRKLILFKTVVMDKLASV